jgi:hypothetical protein
MRVEVRSEDGGEPTAILCYGLPEQIRQFKRGDTITIIDANGQALWGVGWFVRRWGLGGALGGRVFACLPVWTAVETGPQT